MTPTAAPTVTASAEAQPPRSRIAIGMMSSARKIVTPFGVIHFGSASIVFRIAVERFLSVRSGFA